MEKRTRYITIRGDGCQAGYGIGEIIDRIPMAHWRKALRIVNGWYNPPTMQDDDGNYLEVDDTPYGIDGLRIVRE